MADSTGQICLWYQSDAEGAARFYAETFPNSSVGKIHKSPADNPSAKEGEPLTVQARTGVPAAGSSALMLAGLGAATLLRRRRRQS